MGEEKKQVVDDNADQTGAGGSASTTGDAAAADKGVDTKAKSDGEKSFTQTQVSSMMAKEKKQGRDAAFREMGLDPNDTKMVGMFKAFIESQKTEEQKANEEAAENAAKIAEAEHRAIVAETKAEAMQLGVLTQYVDDAVTLVLAKTGSDEKADVKTVIGELKTKYPVWFEQGAAGDGKNDTGQKGTGSSVKADTNGGTGSENKGMGARLAAQRRTKTDGKKSFWS